LGGGGDEQIPRAVHVDSEESALLANSHGSRMDDVGRTSRLQEPGAGFGIKDIKLSMLQTAFEFKWRTSIRQIAGNDLADGWVIESAANQVPADKAGCAGDEQAARNELRFGRQR
jgi:hypothetical protein